MGEYGTLRGETDAARARWVVDALGSFGGFPGIVPPVFEAAVRILHPARTPTGGVLRWQDAADRAWYLASEVDADSTVVGGTRSLVDAIVADGRVEALPLPPADEVDLTSAGDRRNRRTRS